MYVQLPEEVRLELEEKKVAFGQWPAGLSAPKRFVNLILVNKGSVLETTLPQHGYVKSTVANWFNRTTKSFSGDDEKCLEVARNVLLG